jgi:hypothetical protein
MSNTEEYCDHCGDELINFTDRCVVESLPCDIDSANKGESATLCSSCHHLVKVTAERDDAREQAERWEDDALRLMQERNEALKERDEARRIAAYQYAKHHNGEEETLQNNFFKLNGWNTTNKEPQ